MQREGVRDTRTMLRMTTGSETASTKDTSDPSMRHTPRASFVLLGLALASCGTSSDGPDGAPVHIASSYPAVPSLATLAAEVRAANGQVFRGVVQGEPVAVAAERVRATEQAWVEYPMAQITVTVVDAMGSTASSGATLRGRSGSLRVTDAEGNAVNVTTSDDPALPWRAVPTAGEFVFFVIPRAEGVTLLRWRAEIRDGRVLGEGTVGAQSVPLTALSLP